MQYLATALDELCGGWLLEGSQEGGQGALVAQCLQLHLCTQASFSHDILPTIKPIIAVHQILHL